MKANKNILNNAVFLFLAFGALTFSSCKKDDTDPNNPGDPNESELITTIKMTFQDTSGTSPDRQFVFKDADGDGGNPPSVFDTIRIDSQKVYDVTVLLLDESKVPADTISNEVLAEAEDHMFFFFQSGVNINTTYLDADANGIGLGLVSRWISGASSTGISRVVLKHQPGIKDGTFGPGETDIDISFPSIVQ
ncbi:MAG: hypothetical protein ACKOYC_03905 [Bacteroidota bacterium]